MEATGKEVELRKLSGSLLLSGMVTVAALAGIRGPGIYSGVVIFDRWGACHLYSGVYIMEVAESAKELLRPYGGKPVRVDAKDVWQPVNPGDGLIRKLAVLGAAPEPESVEVNRPPSLDGLDLKVSANFAAPAGPELMIEVRNTVNEKRSVRMDALAPTLFAKKQRPEPFVVSDGPSFPVITGVSVALMNRQAAAPAFAARGSIRTARLWLPPGSAIPDRVDLDPNQSINVRLQFDLPPGEYEFLAGYGGGVHAARALVSNRIAFDVGVYGGPQLAGLAAAPVQATPPAPGAVVTGVVRAAGGTPMENARVDHIGKKVFVFAADQASPPLPGEVRTGADGGFHVRTDAPAVVVRNPGYVSQRIRITGDIQLDITLRRIQSTSRCTLAAPPAFRTSSANGIDYAATWYSIDSQDGPRRILSGRGPAYSRGAPSDRNVQKSVEYAEIMFDNGVVDASGHTADGKYWRYRGIFGAAAQYDDQTRAAAAQLDCVMDQIPIRIH